MNQAMDYLELLDSKSHEKALQLLPHLRYMLPILPDTRDCRQLIREMQNLKLLLVHFKNTQRLQPLSDAAKAAGLYSKAGKIYNVLQDIKRARDLRNTVIRLEIKNVKVCSQHYFETFMV
ncbi:hypothetical protein GNI_139370 [Gregarina niphandrodes]|uniref:Uncharacterized protein n=2 Tax=Gregarina niphandrodes TaxID=110365 RepID=A0A023B0E7_GRENI|nr:hypothetical protein GNI_139370 [Gregarina niphandrodes]EZG45337.1 hypothetical protein GNI_139370 [Gregarina niphandrodes]|eukprot:XP_011132524.1 hypothetical protein GNI_139370 [Gregarina niphandrodes]